MSAASDNALAAAGMRAALGGIGDFLLQRQVQAPLTRMNNIQAALLQRQADPTLLNFSRGVIGSDAENPGSSSLPMMGSPVPASQVGASNAGGNANAPAQTTAGLTNVPHVTSADLQVQPPGGAGVAQSLVMPSPGGAGASQLPGGAGAMPSAGGSRDRVAQDFANIPYFQNLPPQQQQAALGQMRKNLQGSKFYYSDPDLIQLYNQQVQESISPMTMMQIAGDMGMTGSKYTQSGGFEMVNPNLMGGISVNGRPSPFVMGPDGHLAANPAYLKPSEIANTRNALAQIQNNRDLLGQVRGIIENVPKAYGPSSAKFQNDPQVAAAQRILGMQSVRSMLDTLSQFRSSRVAPQEWNDLSKSVPKVTDGKQVWENWMGRFQKVLDQQYLAASEMLRPYGDGDDGQQQQLPSVGGDYSGQVLPPGGGQNLPQVRGETDYGRLRQSGYAGHYFDPNGVRRVMRAR